jgi:hypothetical protein
MFIGTNGPWGSAVGLMCVYTYLLCELAHVTTTYKTSSGPPMDMSL